MRYEEAWIWQDRITTAANALGYTVWDLRYNGKSCSFALELEQTLGDEQISALCAHMPLPTDYDGVGGHGSRFTVYGNLP